MLGGYLMDRCGLHRLTLLLSTLVTTGQLIFVSALVWHPSQTANNAGLLFPLFGRLLFGVGGESLAVAQSTFIVRWFASSSSRPQTNYSGNIVDEKWHTVGWLSTIMGCSLAVGRMGSVLNDLLSPWLASKCT
jgi:MFS family permease